MNELVVKENSKSSIPSNVQENMDLINDLLECIRVICDYIVSRKKEKNKPKKLILQESMVDDFVEITVRGFGTFLGSDYWQFPFRNYLYELDLSNGKVSGSDKPPAAFLIRCPN